MLQIIIFVLTNMIQTAESNQSYQFYLVKWQRMKLLLIIFCTGTYLDTMFGNFMFPYLFTCYVWQFHVLVPTHICSKNLIIIMLVVVMNLIVCIWNPNLY